MPGGNETGFGNVAPVHGWPESLFRHGDDRLFEIGKVVTVKEAKAGLVSFLAEAPIGDLSAFYDTAFRLEGAVSFASANRAWV